jgi:dinuclear metal center YbgI/SA1388 family protein
LLREQLLNTLNELLSPHLVKDYCPNGMQVEGKGDIHHIVTGVTASQALIDAAISLKADAIVVHHGYFWKNEPYPIVGIKKRRIAALLEHNINLFAYHLPLDIHPSLGNNAQLAKVLGLTKVSAVSHISPQGIVMQGDLSTAMGHQELSQKIGKALTRDVLSVGNKSQIQRLAWCTGGGQGYIDELINADSSDAKIDAFISGEISEQTTHSARELGIDFYAAGHHATERYGIKALGEYLAETFDVKVSFVDIDNPA